MLEDQPPPFPPEEGACTGHPTDWWFPVITRELPHSEVLKARLLAERAKSICRTCESINECLRYALAYERLGIWGGVDELERFRMRQQIGMRPTGRQDVSSPKWSNAAV
jgi:hypothetical protein